MKRKCAVLLLAVCMILTLLAGCAGNQTPADTPENSQTTSGTTESAPESSAGQSTESSTEQPTETSTEQSSEPSAIPSESASITTNGGAIIELSSLAHQSDSAGSAVYYIKDITPEALMAIYAALEWSPTGKVGVKLSTGEPPASNYLDPNLIKDLVQSVAGTIVECNTAYGGQRSSTATHYQVAEDHGYTAIAPFQILDENGSMTLPVNSGTTLTENYVGAAFGDYDSYIVLSHFKGHAMAGFGGAIKNISIGFGSRQGKSWIHSGGTSTSGFGGVQDRLLESMGDAGKSVSDYLGNGERIVYISVMNHLSIDCDCNGRPAAADMHDIGILASVDPVALDQACIDLVWVSDGNASFINRVNSRNGLYTLENAEKIGLGSRSYKLVDIGADGTPASTYTAGGIVSASGSGISLGSIIDSLTVPGFIALSVLLCAAIAVAAAVAVKKSKKKAAEKS